MTKYKINNNMTRLIKYTLKPKKLNKCVENNRYRQYTHKDYSIFVIYVFQANNSNTPNWIGTVGEIFD